jgi:serine/threonine-protein kinase
MRSAAIKPGDVIGGKYRVRTLLSHSRGVLVEAFHTEFDQRAVIRVLSPALVEEKQVELFRREARTLAKLESEHVARILDVGTLPDGTFYFARQYVEGTDLAAHVKQHGALPLQEAVLMILQACEAVAETHGHGIMLRELQPSHLFLTQRTDGSPQIKLIDFGTAKLMRDASAPGAGEKTATAVFGFSCYASPELIRKASHIDVRTDVWSLGAIFYYMLTGRPPFDGNIADLILGVMRADHVAVTRFRRDVPAEIDAIVHWTMAKDIDGRFADVYAFAYALTPFASAEGQSLIQRIHGLSAAAKRRRREAAAAPMPAVEPGPPIAADALPTRRMVPADHALSIGPKRLPEPPAAAPSQGARSAPPRAAAPIVAAPAISGGTESGRPQWAPPTVPRIANVAVEAPARAPGTSWPAGRTTAIAVMASIVGVLLSITAAMVVSMNQRGSPGPDAGSTAQSLPTASATGSAAQPSPTEPASAASSADQSPLPPPPPAASTVKEPKKPNPPPPPPPAASTVKEPKKPNPPPPPPPAPSQGDTGTIVAVAYGGSCAFSVDGASKGTASTLKLPVTAGTHTVTCKPATGPTKSKSVAVSAGDTAMAMFKL